MRGALFALPLSIGPVGIIPADAGSTRSHRQRSTVGQDHPRGCGEHRVIAAGFLLTRGSSPRMRGALDTEHKKLKGTGIIPADAGSTAA